MSSSVPSAVPPAGDVLSSRLGTAAIVTGVVSIIVGIIAVVWPDITLLVVAVLFAIELIILGVLRLTSVGALPREPGWLRPLTILLGVLTIAAGIVCFFRPNASLVIIAILLAVGWIMEGFSSLAAGFTSGISGGMRAWLIIAGILLVVGGLVIAVFPKDSLTVLTVWAGILFIVIGLVLVVSAIVARRELRKLAADLP
jgi:uncharacterized membrane protein HdeD (DUF308 family)